MAPFAHLYCRTAPHIKQKMVLRRSHPFLLVDFTLPLPYYSWYIAPLFYTMQISPPSYSYNAEDQFYTNAVVNKGAQVVPEEVISITGAPNGGGYGVMYTFLTLDPHEGGATRRRGRPCGLYDKLHAEGRGRSEQGA